MTGQYFGRDGLFALLLNRVHSPPRWNAQTELQGISPFEIAHRRLPVSRHRTLDHLKDVIAPDCIADLLGFGQLSPPLGLLLNVLSPGRIGNSLKMYAFFGYDCF
jgi:hypothetical protein